MGKRLTRRKIESDDSAEIIRFQHGQDWGLVMESGDPIDVSWLEQIDSSRVLVKQIRYFLSDQESKRGVCNTLLQYLRFVVQEKGVVGGGSLMQFRRALDIKRGIEVNTKAEVFDVAKRFVRQLMSEGVLVEGDLPKSFKRIKPVAKSTFIEPCRYELPRLLVDKVGEVDAVKSRYKLDDAGAMGLVFLENAMSAIEKVAEQETQRHIQDWRFVDVIVDSIEEGEKDALLGLSSYTSERRNRTVEEAIKLLFLKFGRTIPPSEGWPDGVADFLKKRKWGIDRVRGAFFPTLKTLDSFLVLALANRELCPNVDSVAFYAYTDCCVPAFDKGAVKVSFGKKRGQGAEATLPYKDPIVVALQALSERIMKYLPDMPGSETLLAKGMVPLMLHCTPSAGRGMVVKTVDKSSTSDMVRRFIRKAAGVKEELKPLVGRVTGENFRPSHSYSMKLAGESVYKIKQVLRHKSAATTEVYIDGVEVKATRNRKMQGFQRYLVDQAKMSTMKRTGSGFGCDEEEKKSSDCIRYDLCYECDARRLIFTDKTIVSEWVAWVRHIQANMERIKFNNPVRWEEKWLPMLCEYEVFISLTKKGVLRNAMKLADDIVLPPIC